MIVGVALVVSGLWIEPASAVVSLRLLLRALDLMAAELQVNAALVSVPDDPDAPVRRWIAERGGSIQPIGVWPVRQASELPPTGVEP